MTSSQHGYWWWLIPISWMAAIFVFSSDWFAWQRTAPVVYSWLQWGQPHLDEPQLESLHLLVRKLGHVMEYALLVLLWHLALRRSHQWPIRRSLFGAAVVSILYAALDEWRQTFTAERSGNLTDIMLDGLGVGLAAGGIGLLSIGSSARSSDHISADAVAGARDIRT